MNRFPDEVVDWITKSKILKDFRTKRRRDTTTELVPA